MAYGTACGTYWTYRSIDTDAPEHVIATPIIAAVAHLFSCGSRGANEGVAVFCCHNGCYERSWLFDWWIERWIARYIDGKIIQWLGRWTDGHMDRKADRWIDI